MLTSLPILWDTSFKPTCCWVNNEFAHWCSRASWLHQEHDYGYISGTLSLQLIKHPRIFEGPIVHLNCFLLKSLDNILVNTTKLVNKMPSGGLLSRVDMPNDNNLNMNLLLTHSDKNKAKQNHQATKIYNHNTEIEPVYLSFYKDYKFLRHRHI